MSTVGARPNLGARVITAPDLFVDMLLGYQRTAAMRAAIGLDIFTHIAAGATSSAALAAATGADARALRILCDYLVVYEILTGTDRRYGLSRTAAKFLDRRSPSWMGSITDFLASPLLSDLFLADPVGIIRNGGSEGLANLEAENPVWVQFAEGMAPFYRRLAAELAAMVAAGPVKPRKVLDIAAGHGLFGIAMAKALPEAEVVAVDWANVLEVARKNAEPVAGRWRGIAGSAFEVDWGDGFDLILLPNFLHHFDHEACVAIAAKCRRSLAPGGRLLVLEFVVNEDRVTPAFPASFAWFMLGTTPKGDSLSPSELDAIARRAGFAGAKVLPHPPPAPDSVIEFFN